jgi:hypothetical protein
VLINIEQQSQPTIRALVIEYESSLYPTTQVPNVVLSTLVDVVIVIVSLFVNSNEFQESDVLY